MDIVEFVAGAIGFVSLCATYYGICLVRKKPDIGGPPGFAQWLGLVIASVAGLITLGCLATMVAI